MSEIAKLAASIFRRAHGAPRILVAIAGAPGSGKTTMAAALADAINAGGQSAAVVAMDGFHYDDAVLEARVHRARKGAPHTFDVGGFRALLGRLRSGDEEVAVPVFDRETEVARNAAVIVPAETRIVLVEGNYLLLDEAPWSDLANFFDMSVYIDVPRAELERRLLERWREHGKSDDAGRDWVASNDMPNVDRVRSSRREADVVMKFEPRPGGRGPGGQGPGGQGPGGQAL